MSQRALWVSHTSRSLEWPLRRGIRTKIHRHLPRPGRAAHGDRERYLAKERLGSNRARKRTIATSRGDDNRTESHEASTQQTNMIHEHRRTRRTQPLRSNPDGNHYRLTNSYRKGLKDRMELARPPETPLKAPFGRSSCAQFVHWVAFTSADCASRVTRA